MADPQERLNQILIQLREPAITKDVARALKKNVEELERQGLSDDAGGLQTLARVRHRIDEILSSGEHRGTRRVQMFRELLSREIGPGSNTAEIAAIKNALQGSGLAGSRFEEVQEERAFSNAIHRPLELLLQSYRRILREPSRVRLGHVEENVRSILELLPDGVYGPDRTLRKFLDTVQSAIRDLDAQESLRGLLAEARNKLSEDGFPLDEVDGLATRIATNPWYKSHDDDPEAINVLEALTRYRHLTDLRQRIDREAAEYIEWLRRSRPWADTDRLVTLLRRAQTEGLETPAGLKQAVSAYRDHARDRLQHARSKLAGRGLDELLELKAGVSALIRSLKALQEALRGEAEHLGGESLLEDAAAVQEELTRTIGEIIVDREHHRINSFSINELYDDLRSGDEGVAPFIDLIRQELREFLGHVEAVRSDPDSLEGAVQGELQRSIDNYPGARFGREAAELVTRLESARKELDSIERDTPGSGAALARALSGVERLLAGHPNWVRAREVKARLENQDRLLKISELLETPSADNILAAREIVEQMETDALGMQLRDALSALEEANDLLQRMAALRPVLEAETSEVELRNALPEGLLLVNDFTGVERKSAAIRAVPGFSKGRARASATVRDFYTVLLEASDRWLAGVAADRRPETISSAKEVLDELVSAGFDGFQGDHLRKRLDALDAEATIRSFVSDGRVDDAWEVFKEAKLRGILDEEEEGTLSRLLKLDGLIRKLESGASVPEAQILQAITDYGLQPRLLKALVRSFLDVGDPGFLARVWPRIRARQEFRTEHLRLAELCATYVNGRIPDLVGLLLKDSVSNALDFLGAVSRTDDVAKSLAVMRCYEGELAEAGERERVRQTASIVQNRVDEKVRAFNEDYKKLVEQRTVYPQSPVPDDAGPERVREAIEQLLDESESWIESAASRLREGDTFLSTLLQWNPELTSERPGALKSAARRFSELLSQNSTQITGLRRVLSEMKSAVGQLTFKIRTISTALGEDALPGVTLAIALMNRYVRHRDKMIDIVDRVADFHGRHGDGTTFEEVRNLKERVEAFGYDFGFDAFGLNQRLASGDWSKTIEELQSMTLENDAVDEFIRSIEAHLHRSSALEERVRRYRDERDPEMRRRHKGEIEEMMKASSRQEKSLTDIVEDRPAPKLSEVAHRRLADWEAGEAWALVRSALDIVHNGA